MSETRIGKIQSCYFGHGGYHDVGVSFALGSAGWGVGDFWGEWAIERPEHAKWSEAERITRLGEMVMRLNRLMADAHVERVEHLVGKPVEVTFDGMAMTSWRILTEAI